MPSYLTPPFSRTFVTSHKIFPHSLKQINVQLGLPGKYGERLKIPENMRKLLSDVTRTLLNTGTITKEQIEGIIGQFERGEYTGMFEGIREGYRKEYRRGYRTAKTRYEKRRQRDQQDREQLETQLRQDREQLEAHIRQLEEEARRLRGE